MWYQSEYASVRIGPESPITMNYIAESHARCEGYDISPKRDLEPNRLEDPGLSLLLQNNRYVISFSHLLFSDIYADLQDDNCAFILTDENAFILDVCASSEALSYYKEKYGVAIGASLAEHSAGTTAAALALLYNRPCILQGDDHFSLKFREWHTVGAPVTDSTGNPSYSVSLCSHTDCDINAKLALVRCLAKEIKGMCCYPDPPGVPKNTADSHTSGYKAAGGLTARQTEALQLFTMGLSYKEIAREMGLKSVKTVEEHLDAVKLKFGVTNRRQCIRYAAELGLL